jgi:hypothetical protein
MIERLPKNGSFAVAVYTSPASAEMRSIEPLSPTSYGVSPAELHSSRGRDE